MALSKAVSRGVWGYCVSLADNCFVVVVVFWFFCMNQWTNSLLFSERSVMCAGTHLKINPFYFGQTDPL